MPITDQFCTAKRILERLQYRLSKFDRSVFLILKPIYYFFGLVFYLETIGSSLDHDLMASIWEKAISILAGNLNSGHSYIITAVKLTDKYE